ncbi:conserved membrane hypothetical protein [Crenothrix polyspora]|uniref:Uncharacterized protein n=1 Tax=Crenothrix polyspora TaxID=360316 RepID=A0A1R4H4S5_9GAMM|nr:hypothetical protein [Crenothrix polyspora]SJM91186.1 conserved membrane hypothetical protein [Crenothrix polyspora]
MDHPAIDAHQLTKFLIRFQAICALVLLLMVSGLDFFFPTQYALKAAVHGISAISALVVGTFITHRAYFLLRGARTNYKSLRKWTAAATLLNFLGAVSGNWIYMRYRGQDGPRDWILKNVPDFHNVLMEFKEFVSLFPFPLMVVATFTLFYYKDHIHLRHDMKQFIAIIMMTSWFFLMLGFVSGLILAKLRFV